MNDHNNSHTLMCMNCTYVTHTLVSECLYKSSTSFLLLKKKVIKNVCPVHLIRTTHYSNSRHLILLPLPTLSSKVHSLILPSPTPTPSLFHCFSPYLLLPITNHIYTSISSPLFFPFIITV